MQRTCTGLTAICLALLLTPAAAGARQHQQSLWSKQQVVGEGFVSPTSTGRALAVNRRGEAVLAWRAPDGVRVALARPGQRFGTSRLIGEGAAMGPLAAVNSRGQVAVVWGYNNKTPPYRGGPRCCQRLRVATLTASGRLFVRYTIAPPETTIALQSIALADDGTIVVAFAATPQSAFAIGGDPLDTTHLMLQVVPFGALLQQTLDVGVRRQLRLLLPERREASALYEDQDEATITEISLGGGRSRRTTDSSDPDLVGGVLGQDAYGDQIAASVRSESGENHLVIATRGHGGKLESRTAMSQPGEFPKMLVGLEPPTLATAPSGWTLVMWSGSSGFEGPDGRLGIWVASADAHNGHVGSPKFLSLPENAGVAGITCAINSHGQALVLVEGLLGSQGGSPRRLTSGFLRLRDGHYKKVLAPFLTRSPSAAIDDKGRGIVLWQTDGQLVSQRFRVP